MIYILIPVYNESDNISKLLPKVFDIVSQLEVRSLVMVVDDSSPDRTSDVAEHIFKSWPNSNVSGKVLMRPRKEGLGKAYLEAFNNVLSEATDNDYIIQMDADLSHDPDYLVNFVNQINQGFELIVASRYIKGGGTPDWSFHRKLISNAGNFYARCILGSKLSDYTGGFNAISVKLLKKLHLSELDISGYGFLINLKFRLLLASKSSVEFPIVFRDRTIGSSKMPVNTIIKNFWLVLFLKYNSMFRKEGFC